jgi:hypothetical protein
VTPQGAIFESNAIAKYGEDSPMERALLCLQSLFKIGGDLTHSDEVMHSCAPFIVRPALTLILAFSSLSLQWMCLVHFPSNVDYGHAFELDARCPNRK